MQREYNNQSDYKIHNSWHFFFKNTLHFHQKVSQKHTKIKIQSLEQGLPGTTQMKLLTGVFEAEPLLAHWIQAVAPLMAKLTQAVTPLLANRTCEVPCKNPKHKENEGSSQKKTRSR